MSSHLFNAARLTCTVILILGWVLFTSARASVIEVSREFLAAVPEARPYAIKVVNNAEKSMVLLASKSPAGLSVSINHQQPLLFDNIAEKPRSAEPQIFTDAAGRHLIYFGFRKGTWYPVVDGCELEKHEQISAEETVFSDDGAHYAFPVTDSDDCRLLVDGKVAADSSAFDTIDTIRFPANGAKPAFRARKRGQSLLVQNDAIVATLQFPAKGTLTFSTDLDHYAYISNPSPGKATVIKDGESLRMFAAIPDGCAPMFVGKSAQVLYAGFEAHRVAIYVDQKQISTHPEVLKLAAAPVGLGIACVVQDQGNRVERNGKLGPAFQGILQGAPVWNPTGTEIAYRAINGTKRVVVLGESMSEPFDALALDIMFSPDGRRYAYWATQAGLWYTVLDGVRGEPHDGAGEAAFSGDSSVFACAISKNGSDRLVLDGEYGPTHRRIVSKPAFIDNDKVAYIAIDNDNFYRVIVSKTKRP